MQTIPTFQSEWRFCMQTMATFITEWRLCTLAMAFPKTKRTLHHQTLLWWRVEGLSFMLRYPVFMYLLRYLPFM